MDSSDYSTESGPHPVFEGVVDPQLSFEDTVLGIPQPFSYIVKRTGEKERFDTRKMAQAIHTAGQVSGSVDAHEAQHIASAVALYLSRTIDGSPTAQEVREAVEKVLVELGHVRTAYVFVNNTRAESVPPDVLRADGEYLLRELERTRPYRRRNSQEFASTPTHRTELGELHGDVVAQRLADVLSEVSLSTDEAAAVSDAVLRRMEATGVDGRSPAVIRELAAEALEQRGLDNAAAEVRPVGLSAGTVRQLLMTPMSGADEWHASPGQTSHLIGRRLKRVYALQIVYTPDIAEAHQRSEIDLGDLSRVDCLYRVEENLERLKRFGLGGGGNGGQNRPPRRPEALVGQVIRQTKPLCGCVTDRVGWEALNYSFVPYFLEHDRSSLREFARFLLYEMTYETARDDSGSGRPVIKLAAGTPEHMRYAPAIGGGGEDIGLTYAELASLADAFTGALLDAYGGALREMPAASLPRLHVDFAMSGEAQNAFDTLLDDFAGIVAAGGRISFSFHRAPPLLPHTEEPDAYRRVDLHQVGLNLEAATRCSRNERELAAEIERLVELAARAQLQKRMFIQDLVKLGGDGPLGALCFRPGGFTVADIEQARCLVRVTGLEALAAWHDTRHGAGDGGTTREDAARRWLVHARDLCHYWSEIYGLNLALTLDRDAVACDGTAADADWLVQAGALHAILPPDETARIILKRSTVPEDVVSVIQRAMHHTDLNGLAFEQSESER